MPHDATKRALLETIRQAEGQSWPYDYWLFKDMLPREVAEAVTRLPFKAAQGETGGRRETLNDFRVFFSPDIREEHQVADAIAAGFQDPDVVAAFEALTGHELAGTYTRVEYCQDTKGFWLEPHVDISAKRFSLLIYLSDAPDAPLWGTDLYDCDKKHVGRAPAHFNSGFLFVPGNNTWHGFEPREIAGIRRSLIVNYVVPDWRARHELSYPDALAQTAQAGAPA